MIWGFRKTRGYFFGVPIIRTMEFWGYIGVPAFWEATMYHNKGPDPVCTHNRSIIQGTPQKDHAFEKLERLAVSAIYPILHFSDIPKP